MIPRRGISLVPIKLKAVSRGLLDREIFHHTNDVLPVAALCEATRGQIVNLAGAAGFHALVSRAYAKARIEAPWLDALHVDRDGCLELRAALDFRSEEALDAQATLLAHLVGLLIALIGPALTRGLIIDAWRDFDFDDDSGELP
jgi:hypothetical protein